MSTLVKDARRVIIFRHIEEATRNLLIAQRARDNAKLAFDRAEVVFKACKDARADATTELFDLLQEEIVP